MTNKEQPMPTTTLKSICDQEVTHKFIPATDGLMVLGPWQDRPR